MMAPSRDDFEDEYHAAYEMLRAASLLHDAALDPPGEERSKRLPGLIRQFCRKLFTLAFSGGVDGCVSPGRAAVGETLIVRADGAENSAAIRASRYAMWLKDVVFPCGPGKTPIVACNGEIPESRVKQAVLQLDDPATQSALRSRPVPDLESERGAIELDVYKAKMFDALPPEAKAPLLMGPTTRPDKPSAHAGPGAAPMESGATPAVTLGPGTKQSTAKGDAEKKLVAALTAHHEYSNGGCSNFVPVGVRELARKASKLKVKVSPGSATALFKKHFQGHDKYKVICDDSAKLVFSLKLLNGEVRPKAMLYGGNPPGEGRMNDEE